MSFAAIALLIWNVIVWTVLESFHTIPMLHGNEGLFTGSYLEVLKYCSPITVPLLSVFPYYSSLQPSLFFTPPFGSSFYSRQNHKFRAFRDMTLELWSQPCPSLYLSVRSWVWWVLIEFDLFIMFILL